MSIKYIKLSNGMRTIIDKDDWDRVKEFVWGFGYGCSSNSGYTPYVGANLKGRKGQVLLHRFIMNTQKGFHTDHINGNHLDNRKKNLRICTPAQNQFNSRKSKLQSSKYKGVSWFKRHKLWRAYISTKGVQIHLGYFNNELEAAKAYNEKSKELFGNFACLNKI